MGLGSVWFGWYLPRASRSAATEEDAPPTLLSSPRGRLLWRAFFTIMGLGWVGFGVIALRYTRGQYVSVPAAAPLLDQVIWIVSLVCLNGSFAMGVVWTLVETAQKQKRHARHEDARDL